MKDSLPSGNGVTNDDPVKTPSPGRRAVLLLIVVAGLVLLGAALVANLHQSYPTVNIAYGNKTVQLRLVDTLYGNHSTFKAEPSSSVLGRVKALLPRDMTQFLERLGWMKGGSTARGFETRIDKPDSLMLIFHTGLGEQPALPDNTTSTKAGYEKTTALLAKHAFEKMHVMLASADHRYMDSDKLDIDASRWSHISSGSEAHPYGVAHFLSVPRNIPEFEMTVYITPNWGAADSVTLKLKNPLYQSPKKPKPPQTLPAKQTKDGVTLVLMKVIGDVGNNLMARESVAGVNAWKLLEEGKYVRANMEEGEYGTTLMQARIIEGTTISQNWKMAHAKFYDTNGNRVGNGFGASQYNGEPEWYQESVNIASVGESAVLRATLARTADFPRDEIHTFELPLPRKNEAIRLDETFKAWNGELHLTAIGNQYSRRTAPKELRDVQGSEFLKMSATGPVGGGYLLKKITLSSTTTTLDLPLGLQGSSWGPNDTIAKYEFRAPINWPKPTGLNTDDYSTVTATFTASRYLEYEFVVKPDLATVPAEPVESWNVFSGH